MKRMKQSEGVVKKKGKDDNTQKNFKILSGRKNSDFNLLAIAFKDFRAFRAGKCKTLGRMQSEEAKYFLYV